MIVLLLDGFLFGCPSEMHKHSQLRIERRGSNEGAIRFRHALRLNKRAMQYFIAFPRSSKRNILEWIHNAKQEATRKKRIEETVRLAARNIRVNHYRQPKKSAGKP